jgi:FkbM family methyltransferase
LSVVALLRRRLPPPRTLVSRRGWRTSWFAWRRHLSDRVVCRRNGLRWTLPTGDEAIAATLFADGDFQAAERAAALEVMRDLGRFRAGRDLVVDLGSNIGTPALQLASDAGLRVLAVEPVTRLFDLLVENVGANGLEDRIVCHRGGVSDRHERATIAVKSLNGGAGEIRRPGHAPTWEPSATRYEEEVDLAPLPDILARHGVELDEIAFVWADIQGSEARLLSSGEELWRHGIPLCTEIWPFGLQHQGDADAFLTLATRDFVSFVDLRSSLDPRPIAELAELFTGRDRHWDTDVVLAPRQAEPARRERSTGTR